jgi:transcription elongation factor Elf1
VSFRKLRGKGSSTDPHRPIDAAAALGSGSGPFACIGTIRQDDVRVTVQGKERAVSVTRKRERDAPFACPHCGKEIVTTQANLGTVGRALREKIAMICPHCGQEFYVTLDPGDALMTYVVALDAPADDDAERDERTD